MRRIQLTAVTNLFSSVRVSYYWVEKKEYRQRRDSSAPFYIFVKYQFTYLEFLVLFHFITIHSDVAWILISW